MSDELVDLKLALHVIVDQARELGAAFNSAKSTTLEHLISNSLRGHKNCEQGYLPNTASNELECCDNVSN